MFCRKQKNFITITDYSVYLTPLKAQAIERAFAEIDPILLA